MLLLSSSMSQPAWAAWIEIAPASYGLLCGYVAARMGCVDGNSSVGSDACPPETSQPAWAAWIEMLGFV